MKDWWLKVTARLDAMANRERIAVFAGGLAVIFALLWAGAVEPVARKARAARAELASREESLKAFTAQKAELDAELRRHPDDALAEKARVLEDELGRLAGEIQATNVGLVEARRMVSVVRDLVTRTPGVALVSLETLPVEPFDAPEEPAAGVPAAGPGTLYKHGVRLTVEGSYASLLSYCKRLEGLSVRAVWNRTHVDASRYPAVRMTLTLYTLSLERTWMTL